MKVFKLCIILIAYLLIGVLEVYSYYLFKNDAIGIFTFFTLLGFIMTFGIEVLKDISQLTKGCGVTFIKNDNFHFYEYLMVHPNRDTYFLFIDNWSQEVVRIYINDLLSGDYYIGKYDRIFVMEKRKDFFKRMIKNCDKRIEELKRKIF